MKRSLIVILMLSLSLMLIACSGDNAAQPSDGAWEPKGDVNVIVAFKAGSGTDTGARILSSVAEKYVGKTLVIVNKEGADGKIGYTELSNSKPDGQTIGFINLPTFNSLALEPNTVFSSETIVPIANHLSEPSVLVVRKDSPFETLEDLIDYCKANPDTLKVSTNGVKASNHIGMQLLSQAADFTYKAIPYGGTADQLLALRQGEVEASVPKVADIAPLVGENGELKILASYTAERLDDFPDVPTMTEKGFPLIYGSYRCLVAPKGTPDNVIEFYAEAFKKAMEDPDNIEKSDKAGLSLNYMGPADLKAFIESQNKFAKEVLPTLFGDE